MTTEKSLETFKITGEDGFEVCFEVLPPVDDATDTRSEQVKELDAKIADCDSRISDVQRKVDELNKEIDRLTNHADGIDYTIAVLCGLIAGVIDVIYVGAWDIKDAKAKANEDVNRKIEAYARKLGWEDKNNKGLKGAVEFLEKKFPFPGDNDWKGKVAGVSAKSHHLDDFAHHPTLVGLVCSIIRQFTGKATYHNSSGQSVTLPVTVNEYGELEGTDAATNIFSGVVNWFINCAKTIKSTAENTKGHWKSDLAGSKQSAGAGSGLPGSFMSILKELSACPIFNSTDAKGNQVNNFADALRRAFTNGIGNGKKQLNLGVFNSLFDDGKGGIKMDYRGELAVKNILKKQMVPVLVNEGLVRGAYFIRRLIQQIKEKPSISEIEWDKVIPFRNRTIARMMTIASGTFLACDLADATIRAGVKNGFNVYNPKFWSDMILRINFPNVGRFAVAVAVDVGSGIKRGSKEWEKIIVVNEQLHLMNAKTFYMQGKVWVAAKETKEAMEEMYLACENAYFAVARDYGAMCADIYRIGEIRNNVEQHNPGLCLELSNALNDI